MTAAAQALAPLRYISLFSGIEAASVAWGPLGFNPVCFSEIDPFPSAVLAEHYPDVPNLGDITKVDWSPYKGQADLVVGGSPCQSFSQAGKREGLNGASGLMFEYIRAVSEIRPRWFLWENVPGALTSERGEAFRQLLSEMDQLGYGLAWRVLDAQFFGVAQRRERVFLVGHLGDTPPAGVLFEPDGMPWDFAQGREKRAELAARLARSPRSAGFKYAVAAASGSIAYGEELSPTLIADYHGPAVLPLAERTRPTTYVCQTAHSGSNGLGVSETTVTPTLDTNNSLGIYCMSSDTSNAAIDNDCAGTLHVGGGVSSVAESGRIRRLTPVEYERLQGFPDDWTRVAYRGKPAEKCPDGPRYKAVGNSMAVPVMRWIGRRIALFDMGLIS